MMKVQNAQKYWKEREKSKGLLLGYWLRLEAQREQRKKILVASVFSFRHVPFTSIPLFFTYFHPFPNAKQTEAWFFKSWLHFLEAVLFSATFLVSLCFKSFIYKIE